MKKLATINTTLKIIISLAGVLMLIGWFIAPTYWTKPLSYLTTIIIPYIPDLFKFIKVNFSQPLVLAYELFLIISMVLGIDLNWYSEVLVTATGDSYFDKIVHFSSGVLVAAVAGELFRLYTHQSSPRRRIGWFQILFLIGVVALVTVGWECYEFLYDVICGGHMQELVKTGVTDTMLDMIASMTGGIICSLCLMRFQNLPKPDKTIDKK